MNVCSTLNDILAFLLHCIHKALLFYTLTRNHYANSPIYLMYVVTTVGQVRVKETAATANQWDESFIWAIPLPHGWNSEGHQRTQRKCKIKHSSGFFFQKKKSFQKKLKTVNRFQSSDCNSCFADCYVPFFARTKG